MLGVAPEASEGIHIAVWVLLELLRIVFLVASFFRLFQILVVNFDSISVENGYLVVSRSELRQLRLVNFYQLTSELRCRFFAVYIIELKNQRF